MIINNLCDIRTVNNQHLDNAEALAKLLRHASATVDAYSNYANVTSLEYYPVVNKSILRDDLTNHLSKLFDKSQLVSTTTSGSTGTPFTIYFDRNKINRHRAALMYWNERAGAPLGQRLYYLRVWNKMNKKGKIAQLIENIIPVEVSNFGAKEIKSFIKCLKLHRCPVAILGFSSALVALSRSVESTPKNVKGIIAMSEHMPEAVRLTLQEQFCCPVYARYSNMENGFIAQQFDDSGEYQLNTADFIVEILDMNEDKPVAYGEKGRIVVTDLYNYAMPFIRYDTGDIGSIKVRPNGMKVLTAVEGRKSDVIYDTSGKILSAYVVTNTMWAYTEISQFQFIQKDKTKYLFRLNLKGSSFDRESELITNMRKYLGEDAELKFEYVNEIPVLNSGKRRYIINEYK